MKVSHTVPTDGTTKTSMTSVDFEVWMAQEQRRIHLLFLWLFRNSDEANSATQDVFFKSFTCGKNAFELHSKIRERLHNAFNRKRKFIGRGKSLEKPLAYFPYPLSGTTGFPKGVLIAFDNYHDGACLRRKTRRLLAQLSRNKMPHQIVFTESLPRTVSGKPMRAKIAEQYSHQERIVND
jgi:acyl-coenzyme A synthetase/AMP-(fatty) acid ligase